MGHIDWTVQGTKHPCKFNSLSKIELCDQAIGEKIGSGSKQKNGGKLLVPEPRTSRLSRTVPCSERRWCPGTESNRHVPCGTRDFKSRASASFATRAPRLAHRSRAPRLSLRVRFSLLRFFNPCAVFIPI